MESKTKTTEQNKHKDSDSHANEHLRKYGNRPSQTYIESIGWVRDSKLNNPIVKAEMERIKARTEKRKVSEGEK